ncbi:hypothetical protein RJ641_001283 [Dillenia turbinata]|uniref:BTB domain-containing protein n=1 Tax=Dillenia turbinata TaxID=194707 RepID=A0AAN8W886_9MAGN
MATTTTSSHHNLIKVQVQPTKPKRRKYRETTISSSATTSLSSPTIVSPENSWCCPSIVSVAAHDSNPDTSPPDQETEHQHRQQISVSVSGSPSNFKTRFSPVMDFSPVNSIQQEQFPSSLSKFNTALTAGLLNPMSPPPQTAVTVDKTRSSPTLFEMMASEPDCHPKCQTPVQNFSVSVSRPPISAQDKQAFMLQRISDIVSNRSPGNQFNDPGSSDIRLTLSSKDGFSVSMNVHRQILVGHSRFFAVKLSDRWVKQQRSIPYVVEIADCDDVEVYIEALRLMYCKELRKKLMKEDVPKVLGILKVSSAIGFDAGVLSCLEYLEAAPWAEDEEEKVAALLSQLQLDGAGAGEVLKRVSIEVNNGVEEGTSDNEEVLLKLLQVVLEGKDEKARREMKALVLKMLRENSSQNDLRKESLYLASDQCMQLLRNYFLKAANSDLQDVGHIARQADNLHWILDILIDRQIAEDFLKMWASQSELSNAHSKVPAVHRYEVSRVTARLFVGIGKGQLLASKDARCLLLRTWLVPFYDDFGWMRRASKGLDRHLIEDGLSNTILTLPLAWQQDIFLSWFDRFLNSGEDSPNIQKGFEVWWRRAFWRRNGEPERPQQVRITTRNCESQ